MVRLGKPLILGFSFLALYGCQQKRGGSGLELFPDMVHSVAYEAYSESSVTDDGKSMLKAPPNSIARNFMPFPFGEGEEEAIRAGRLLQNPYPKSEKTLARGKFVYDNYCLVCHGEKGGGDGPLIPKFPNPPSLTSKRLKEYPDGRLYHIITRGSGTMPEHATQILPQDRWYLVQYIKQLQGRE